MSEQKKISFGFSKLTKKPSIFSKPVAEEKKIQLIDCLEGQSIKIKDAVEEESKPLVIPIKDNGKNLLDRVREANELKERSRAKIEAETKTDERPDSELTLDELAARQLIKEAQKLEAKPNAIKVHTLPAIEDKLILEGSVEPTIEDYENVPIGDYGMAMLRGMGWSEDKGIGKSKKSSLVAPPELRPKGMGLGASVMINKGRKVEKAVDKNGKELNLIKGAFAKIIAGNEKGNYCVVQGLDDEAGRIIVKTSLKGNVLALNEFLLIPVTSDEYSKYSKVLNNDKYDQYKHEGENVKRNGELKTEEIERKSDKYVKKREDSTSSVEILKSKTDEVVDLTDSHRKSRKDRVKSRSRSKEKNEYRGREGTRSRSKERESSRSEEKVRTKERKRSRSRENYKNKSNSRDSRKVDKEGSSRRNQSESRSRSRGNSKEKSSERSRRSKDRKYRDVSTKNKKYRDSSSDSVSRDKTSKNSNKSKKSKKHRERRRSSSSECKRKEKKNKKGKSRRESISSSDDYEDRSRRNKR